MEHRLTPIELAKELGHEPEARPGLKVRTYLRKYHPRPESEKGTLWFLTQAQADDVRAHFNAKARQR